MQIKLSIFVILLFTGVLLSSCKSGSNETSSTITTEQNSTLVTLSKEEQKELNIFFSNFAEVSMSAFSKESLTDAALIDFAVRHEYINNNKKFELLKSEPVQAQIKESYIQQTVDKYFGREITKAQPSGDIQYANGYYTLPMSDGDYKFAQVESVSKIGEEGFLTIYSAIVNLYVGGSGWTGNAHGTMEEWKKDSPDDIPQIIGKMKATYHKGSTEDGKRCILIDYTEVK